MSSTPRHRRICLGFDTSLLHTQLLGPASCENSRILWQISTERFKIAAHKFRLENCNRFSHQSGHYHQGVHCHQRAHCHHRAHCHWRVYYGYHFSRFLIDTYHRAQVSGEIRRDSFNRPRWRRPTSCITSVPMSWAILNHTSTRGLDIKTFSRSNPSWVAVRTEQHH